jgi:DNA modification methylase
VDPVRRAAVIGCVAPLTRSAGSQETSFAVAEMPDRSVGCIVTSPPYFGLRDYGLPGQYGLEATAEEYVDNLRRVFGEAKRVLANNGTEL